MTEREELEYAANAIGKELEFIIISRDFWNPREDDGDCGRLEAALGIDVFWYDDFVEVQEKKFVVVHAVEYADHNNDKQKARKHAVTRLAAEIGKAKKVLFVKAVCDWVDKGGD
jgi:hypothetical protein